MLSLGDSNSPFSSTDAEAEACSTAAFVLIMLTTAPLALSFGIGCWRLSTSCTVPRMLAAQADTSSRTVRASSALAFMISLRLITSRFHVTPHAGVKSTRRMRTGLSAENASVANVRLSASVAFQRQRPLNGLIGVDRAKRFGGHEHTAEQFAAANKKPGPLSRPGFFA